MSVEPKLYGCRSMTGRLERVLVRAPGSPDGWEACGWRGAPDPVGIAREHEALCSVLERAGAEVVLAESPAENPDAIYTFDSVLVSDDGAILLNPGKELRRGEPAALAEDLERAGVPIAGRLTGHEHAEGGDLIRLDERTLPPDAATGRTRPASRHCAACCPTSRCSCSTCRTGTAAAKSCTCSRS